MVKSSRFRFPIQVGTAIAKVVVTAGVVIYALGIIQMEQVQFINRDPVLSGTGVAGTQIDYLAYNRTAFANTGGVVTYDVFSFASPLTTTGSIDKFCIEVATATPHATMKVDCGIIGDASTATGTDLFDGETLSAGLHCAIPGATELLIGPTERIKCGSLSGTGGGLDAEGFTEYHETILN